MIPASQPANDTVERTALIHREIFQLTVLILVAIGAFLLTRAVAASNREMSLRDAAEWYRQGQQAIEAGRVDDAIDSLRRATVRNRSDTRYVLALARALALKGDDDAARSVLLTLRESTPEDPDINLQLARLAAARQDVTDALRFYHNALYAPWPADQADARRRVRLELIRFLLTHDQASRALSELLALSTDLPDDVPLRLEGGDSCSPRLATTVTRWTSFSGPCVWLLRTAKPSSEPAKRRSSLAITRRPEPICAGRRPTRMRSGTLVKSSTWCCPTIRWPVVSARPSGADDSIADFSYAQQRLSSCLEQRSGGQPTSDELALQSEAQAFEDQLKRPRSSNKTRSKRALT